MPARVVIPEHAGFDEMSVSASARQAIGAVTDVAGAKSQLSPLTVELRHLVDWMIGVQRV